MNNSPVKEALDEKESTMTASAYPTYSMAILWNMDARTLNRDAGLFADIPVDGDAPARSRGRLAKNAAAWAQLKEDGLALLRGNHGDADKVDAR